MELSRLCCAPEQSRKFAELGKFEDSVFVFGTRKYVGGTEILMRGVDSEYTLGPATTVQELGGFLDEWENEPGISEEEQTKRHQICCDLSYRYFLDPEQLSAEILQIIEEQ